MLGMFLPFGGLFFCPFALIGIALFAFWLWMLIDVIQNENGDNKVVWVLVVILASWIGALIYFFVRKQPRGK